MKTRMAFFSAALVGAISGVSQAVSIPVNNYNFSDPLIPTTSNSGYYTTGIPTGWSSQHFSAQYYENGSNGGFTTPISSPGSDPVPNPTGYQPGLSGPNYQYVADDGTGTIYQDLGVAFKPNTTYTVDISGGNRSGFPNNYSTFGLVSSNTTIPTDGTAPATLPGASTGFINEGALPVGSFNYASVIGSPDAQVFTFTTGGTAPGGDVVVYVNNSSSGRLELGGVVVTAVPEPACLGLLSLAAMGVLGRRRRA